MKHEILPRVDVPRETAARLDTLADLIRRWSPTLNLVSPKDLAELHSRHIADSLQVLPLLPAEGLLVDLGSGAGFPGLVLAVASGRAFRLIEADRRKAAFLREAARVCSAQVEVITDRIETIAMVPKAAAVTARALAPLTQLLSWAADFLHPTGVALFHKGRRAEQELTQAAVEWHMTVRRWQSTTDAGAFILQVSNIHRHGAAHD